MEELIYCYNTICEKIKMNMNKEEFIKLIKLMYHFIKEYNLSFGESFVYDNNLFFKLTSSGIDGYLVINSDSISVKLNKQYYQNFNVEEYLTAFADRFEGSLGDFAYNDSQTKIKINNNNLEVTGSIINTKFNNLGAFLGNKFIPYTASDDFSKLDEAMRIHCENGRTKMNDFLIYDELNIRLINFIDDGFEKGESKIFKN